METESEDLAGLPDQIVWILRKERGMPHLCWNDAHFASRSWTCSKIVPALLFVFLAFGSFMMTASSLRTLDSPVRQKVVTYGSTDENATSIMIAAETWQPFFLIGENEEGDPVYSGIMWDLLLLLAVRMNLRFEIVRPPDGLWGVELQNGSWNGMLGMIQREEAEMALGPFAISYPRTKVASFPPAIFVFPHWLFLPRPKGVSDLSDFVRLFHPMVWLSIFGTGIIIAGCVWIVVLIDSTTVLSGEERIRQKKDAAPSLIESLLHMWGILYQVSIGWKPPLSVRFLMSLWMLGTLILMRTYSGLLVASLTVPSVPIPIRSMEDLVGQTEMPWRLEQGGIILHTFKTADVKMYKILLDGNEGFFPDCYAARQEIAEGSFAGICDSLSGNLMVAKTFSSSGRCDYYTPRETIVTHSYTLVLRRKSPFMKSLRFWLQELQERGWVDQLLNKVVNNGTQCSLPPGKEGGQPPATPLDIQQMWGAFAILASGLGGAAIAFVAETITRKMN